jgi:serine/threonine-protein kinase HipA
MTIASSMGIEVPPHTLIQLKDGTLAYIVLRFDRTWDGKKIHCEDFSQILQQDKYSGSVEQVGKRLKEISQYPELDAQYLLERVLLSYLIGNGDAHLKNFSIIYDQNGGGKLAPAYDIVSSTLVIPEEEELALTLNGKKNRVTRNDFKDFAEDLGIQPKPLGNIFDRFQAGRQQSLELVADSKLPSEFKDRLGKIIEERHKRLFASSGYS